MDWGVSKGLSKLYGATGKRESARNDLAILGMVDQKRKADAEEEKLARQEYEAYQEKVNAFSSTLLAPDRKRINEKAKQLSKKVRENVQMYGGDMSKFMANGGGQVMRDYKNSLLHSEEAATYAENKKNMDLIVKAQLSGKSGLINATDLANLRAYNKNGIGQITYTGLLSEIEMPNAQAYDYGTNVPAEDILKNKSNYTKIYGNYVTTYPNLPPPTQEQLIQYTKLNHSQMGENWHRPAAAQKMANEKAARAAKAQKDAQKDLYAYGFKTTEQVANVTRSFPKGITSTEFKEGYWNDEAKGKLVNDISSEAYTQHYNDFALREKGFMDVRPGNDFLQRWITEEYSVRNARMIYQGDEMQFAAASLGIMDEDRLNFASKEIKDWMPDNDSYTASGVRVGDLDDELDKEAYKGTWRVEGVIIGAHGKTGNGGSQMVMNVVDAGKIDEEKTTKWDDEVLQGSEIEQDTFVVMADKDGNVFYKKVDMSNSQRVSNISERMGTVDDFGSAIRSSKYTQQRNANAQALVQQQEKPINSFLDRNLNKQSTNVSIHSELLNYSPDGNINTRRQKLLTSFYTALSNYGQAEGDSTYEAATKQKLFTDMLMEGASNSSKDYISMLKDPNMTDEQFLSIMAKDDPDNVPFYEQWIASYDILSRR